MHLIKKCLVEFPAVKHERRESADSWGSETELNLPVQAFTYCISVE